ncbi:MAG TPA: hypothetical protein DDZ88_25315 [Verrucomicrobiales bacterium]|nr:hypothetical protein [Verrucomicrobiales bacterium]
MPATQRQFPIDDPAVVLASVATARHHLRGYNEDAILDLIESGELLYAWNIGLGPTRLVRIWPACLEYYQKNPASAWKFPQTEDQVLSEMLRRVGDKPFIRSYALRLIFNCSATHITNLLHAGALRVLPNTTWGRGPSGSALITITSVKQFLVERRLP